MTDSFRELDRRTNDRLDVALLWRETDGLVIVAVTDEKTGADFAIPVHEGERALDVFNHPYAYAAHRGIEPRPGPAQPCVSRM